MRQRTKKIIVIGYGNPGRLDDGLGPAFADAVEKLALPNVTVESNYQLTVEDASLVAEYDIAVFADADIKCPKSFSIRRIEKDVAPSYTTHIIEPETVLSLARRLFDAKTKGYLLGIRGYEFNEFGERLSEDAEENLSVTLDYVKPFLVSGCFDKIEHNNESSVAHAAHIRNGD